MKVIAYIRVSSQEQALEGVSLGAQAEKIRLYCRLHTLDLVGLAEDAGVSAKSLDRPGLRRALEVLESGQAQGLVIAKLDRLSRSVTDWGHLVDRYFGRPNGPQLLSVADSIDTRRAAGRLVLNVLMSVAQWERETIVERTCEAMAFLKARGDRLGAVPYGWDAGPDGDLVENSAEQAVLALLRRLKAEGRSLRWIARELTDLHIPTKRGARGWSHTAVRDLLKRETDRGTGDESDKEAAASAA